MLCLDNVRVPGRVGAITTEIPSKNHIALLGPNGSGKSSLLLALAGLISCKGNVLLQDESILAWPIDVAALKRALLPQRTPQLLPIACHEVIGLGASALNLSRAAKAAAIQEICQRLELGDFLRRDFSCLSGGEQQRVLLAKTLLQIWPEINPHAKLLMLDEPLAGLDFYHQLQLLDLLKELTSHGLTVISSIHDFNLAITHADYICCLEQGKLKFADQASAFNENLIREVFHIATIKIESQGQTVFVPWQTSKS